MKQRSFDTKRTRSVGFVMGYLLAVLGIASVVLMGFARLGNQSNDGKRMADTRDEAISQATLIRSKIIACTVYYPGGNNGTGYRTPFPGTPASGFVSDALCPGNPNANKTIWTSSDGVFSPRQLNGLSVWSYTNDATSARITITATGSGNVPIAALHSAALRFGSLASMSGSTLTLVIAN